MSEASPSAPEKAGTPKQPVSPARNIIGLIVLVAVIAIGWLQYSARGGYNTAVEALNHRLEDEDHGLMTQQEAEQLIGKEADDAGSEVKEDAATYIKKTYTWRGVLKSYTLTAFYTKQQQPALHHIKTEGATEETAAAPAQSAPGTSPPPTSGMPSPDPTRRFEAKGKASMKTAPADQPKADEKAQAPEPKAAADEKPKAPEPKADEKPKAAADEKAKAPAKTD
jgi:hypothetical protein